MGTGPYVLREWDKGVQLVYRAFDQFFLGRPPLDEVTIRIIGDSNAVVANVLSGTVDVTLGTTLTQQGGEIVREQWSNADGGVLIRYPTSTRYAHIQHDPARRGQPALADVRVRQAIVLGLDRQSIAETISAGTSRAAEQLLTPGNPLYPRLDQATPALRFDRARALALLQDAGWSKRGDALANANGQPFTLDIRTPDQADNDTQMSLMTADLTALGMQVTQTLQPLSVNSDREAIATFPGLYVIAGTFDNPDSMRNFTSAQCPNAEGRFVGNNAGCWKNPEYDRLFRVLSTSLDDRERDNATIQALKVLADDAGAFGTAYFIENVAVRKGLAGPGPRWPTQKGNTWNIYEWHWS